MLVIVSFTALIPSIVAKNTIALCRGIQEPGVNAYARDAPYSAYPEITDDNIIIPSQTYAFDECNFDISRLPTRYSWKYQCCGTNYDEVCMEVFEGTNECITGTGITVHSYTFTDADRTFNCDPDPDAEDCKLSYDWYANCNETTNGCDLCYHYATVHTVSGGCAKDYTSWGDFQGYYVSSHCKYDNTDYFVSGWFTDDRCTVPTPGSEGGYNVVTLDDCGRNGPTPGPGIKNYQCNDMLTTYSPTLMPTIEPTTQEPTGAPTTLQPTASPSTLTPTDNPIVASTVSATTGFSAEQSTEDATTEFSTEETRECKKDDDCYDGESCKYSSLSCILGTDESCTGVCVEDDGYCEDIDKGNAWGSWYHLLNDPEQCHLCFCVEKGARHCEKIYDIASDKEQWQDRVAETCPYTVYPKLDDGGKQCAFDDLWIEDDITECTCDVLLCAPQMSRSNQMEIMVGFGIVSVVVAIV